MEPITDPHFFKNTHKAVIRKSYKNTTEPHKNRPNQLKGKLLLIVDWRPTIEFIYETYSIFAYENNTIEITKEKQRTEQTNEEVIQEYIERYRGEHLPKDIKRKPDIIIACNPEEYSKEKLLSQVM